ncbi:MAG: caspase family protein [Chloroflexi bacterium]|nr:caspase family protein [Chloroflexota bacterium]
MAETFSHGHALLIGVGDDLPETVADAQAIGSVLTDKTRAAFPQEQVTLLTEQAATRDKILTALGDFVTRVNADSDATALIYYSGHGGEFERMNQPTDYFFVPYGYAPTQYQTTSIRAAEFTQQVESITAKKLIVVLDCCHAAGMPAAKAVGEKFVKGNVPVTLLHAMESGSGRVVIASSRNDESSYGGNPNSLFTACLLEALSGKAARVADGYVRVLDVLSYLFAQVPSRAAPKQQHPFVNKITDLSDNFALCYYAAGAKEVIGVPVLAQTYAAYSEWETTKLETERTMLMPAYTLRAQKIAFLERDLVIQAGSAVKFQLEQEILQERAAYAEMEKRLTEIDRLLQAMGH